MANFSYGRNLPRHELMRNLLGELPTVKRSTRSTQTTPRKFNSEISIGRTRDEVGFKKEQVKLRGQCCQSSEYINLMKCLKERVIRKEEEDLDSYCNCCESDDDGWSDYSCSTCDVVFPKETRNAVSMIIGDSKKRENLKSGNKAPPPPPPMKWFKSGGGWPGVAARCTNNNRRDLDADNSLTFS